MKKFLLLLLLATPAFAGKSTHFDDPSLNQEFDNNYHEHSYPNWVYAKGSSATITYISSSSGTFTGSLKVKNGSASNDAVAFGQLKFIQFVSSITTKQTSTTLSTPVNTTLSKSITPTSTANHILIYVSGGLENAVVGNTGCIYISGNNAGNPGLKMSCFKPVASVAGRTPASFVYDDGAVGTVSPITYSVQLASLDNTNTVSFPTGAGERGAMIIFEVSP